MWQGAIIDISCSLPLPHWINIIYIYIYIYIYKCNNKKFCIDAIQQFGGYLLGTKHKIFFLVDGVMRLLCAVIPTSGDMGMLTQE